jgi:hypothetical protein
MAIDTPARIAIVGAGPTGLEATLYARFLGYDVDTFESASIGEALRPYGPIELPWTFGELSSPLGRTAILTQNPEHRFPADDASISVETWLSSYLLPLAEVDLVVDSLRPGRAVAQIGREGLRRSDVVPFDDRFDELFLLRIADREGNEEWIQCDIVIDAGGGESEPAGWGVGGLDPIGAARLASESNILLRHVVLPDDDRQREWADRSLLVVGDELAAIRQLDALLELKRAFPETTIDWVVRGNPEEDSLGDRLAPLVSSDPRAAERLARIEQGVSAGLIRRFVGLQVASVSPAQEGWWIDLVGAQPNRLRSDRIFALTGFRPDFSAARELQLDLSPETEGPRAWADYLNAKHSGTEPRRLESAEPLINREPNYYVIGRKSYGRRSDYRPSIGLDQIRALFTLIADRPGLDLYRHLPTESS